MRESAAASHIRLEAARTGVELWRNNNGAFEDARGRWIRYGLCNESKKQSDRVKSSDFIGITPVLITPEMVGSTVGVFTAIETKPTGWKLIPSDMRGKAQKAFHDIVIRAGGKAGFASTIEHLKRITGK